MRKIIVGSAIVLSCGVATVILSGRESSATQKSESNAHSKETAEMPYPSNSQSTAVPVGQLQKKSAPMRVISPSETRITYAPEGSVGKTAAEDTRQVPLSTAFETMSPDEVSDFLSENTMTNGKLSVERSPSFATAPGTAEKFTGVFRGRLERLPDLESDLIPDEGQTLVLALQGKVSGVTYQGKQDLYIFSGNHQVSHLSGQGNIRDVKTDPRRPPNIVFVDSPRDPSYFQLFVSESAERIIGSYYITNPKTARVEKIGRIELTREHP